MHIKEIIIENFKCFEGRFQLALNNGLNILVGDNEAGKTTILEAIHLSLTGWICGKYLSTELTQSLFNKNIIDSYLESLKNAEPIQPPFILIELYLEIEDDSIKALFEGNGNSLRHPATGIQFKISFNNQFQGDYKILLNAGEEITSLPIEYYEFSWSSFARDDRITPKTIPIKSALIDSSNIKNQNGSDIYVTRIIRELLTEEQKIKISQAYRKLKDQFSKESAILAVNEELKQKEVSNKKIELSVDLPTKTAWETSLMTYLDNIPFNAVGKGEQSLIKTKLALSHKKAQEASIILLEEPENHLSHSKLNNLISHLKNNNEEKQIILSTHNSFVANKLGLNSLILVNIDRTNSKRTTFKFTSLVEETKNYFQKLPGYDTLRLLLCKKAILVEGPSDELIIQKAYMSKNNGKIPIEDEIDVISVRSLAFKRFLDIAIEIKQPVVVVTDNDGNFDKNVTKKYEAYNPYSNIKICADFNENLYSLEPQIVEVNNLETLRNILGLDELKYSTKDSIIKYMGDKNNKADCAIKIFDSDKDFVFPQYILDAIV